MAKFFNASGFIGGTADQDVDALTGYSDGDPCKTIVSGIEYLHQYDASEAGAESSPDIIIPDDNATGTGAWVLRKVYLHPEQASTVSIAAKTYYISAAGSDTNDGLSSGAPFATWAKVHSMIPDLMRHAYEIRIIGDLSESIYVEGKRASYGRDDWRLTIVGNTTTADDHEVLGAYASNAAHVSFNYIKVTGEAKVMQSNGVRFHYSIFNNSGDIGVRYNYSTGAIQYCSFGTDVNTIGIMSFVSTVWSDDNSGNATQYGLQSSGGVITTKRTQPTGTTCDIHLKEGGIVSGSPGTRVTANSGWTQSIADNDFTDVSFGATGVVLYEASESWWDSDYPAKLTVPENGGGLYVISASIRWAGSATTGKERYISVRAGASGSTVEMASNQMYPAVNETNVQSIASGPVWLTPGDEILLRVRQKSGGALNLTYAAQSAPILAVHKV